MAHSIAVGIDSMPARATFLRHSGRRAGLPASRKAAAPNPEPAHNEPMRKRRLSALLAALILTACAVPSRYAFESGSAEDRAARYVAEWGGAASEYRAIFQTADCTILEVGLGTFSSTPQDLDTRAGRQQAGYYEARQERLEELDC